MFRSRNHAGYGLVALLLLLIAVASSALGVKIYQQSKMYVLQDELIIETLHQTRMAIMRYYQKHGHWPSPPFPGAISEYVAQIELIAGNEPALRIQLSSGDRVTRVQRHLAASWQHGNELWLRLATKPEGLTEDDEAINPHWLERGGEAAAAMNASLAMQHFAINNTERLLAEKLTATSMTSSEVDAEAFTSSSLKTTELNSATLAGDKLDSGQLTTAVGSSQRVNAGIADIQYNLDIGNWQQQQIRMQETITQAADFTQATAVNVSASSVFANALDAQSLLANTVGAEGGQVSNLITQDLSFLNGQVNQTNTQALSANAFSANAVSSNKTIAQNVIVNNTVTLPSMQAQTLDALHGDLDNLYRNLYNCVYENRWCEAPQPTPIALQQCQGCNREQSNENFVANITVAGNECVHGCEFEVRVNGANGTCSPERVAPRQSGNTACTLTKQLAPGESWQQMVRVRARNAKDLSVFHDLPIMLNWQRTLANCPSFQIQEQIHGTEPLTFTTLVFAVTAAGSNATVTKSGIGCASMGSEWHCNGTAQCSATGQWQNVQAYCGCGF